MGDSLPLFKFKDIELFCLKGFGFEGFLVSGLAVLSSLRSVEGFRVGRVSGLKGFGLENSSNSSNSSNPSTL